MWRFITACGLGIGLLGGCDDQAIPGADQDATVVAADADATTPKGDGPGATDAAPDVLPDAAPDVLPDAASDALPDAAPEVVADPCPARVSSLPGVTVTGDGRYRTIRGLRGADLPDRDLTVRLPADYGADPSRRYGVLYMHDGQNLFFPETSAFGEWGVDEATDALVAAGVIEPLIVVGLHNTADRMGDYTPTVDPDYGGGNAAAYTAYVADVVKPAIDRLFGTRCGRDDTGVMGSSLGGLVSFHMATARPDVFGRVGVVSPSFWWDGSRILDAFDAYDGPLPARLWIDMGTEEGASSADLSPSVALVRRARDRAIALGMVVGDDLGYLEDPGAAHNEPAWRARLPAILGFLYGRRPAPAPRALTLRFVASDLYDGRRERTSAMVEVGDGAAARLTIPNDAVGFEVAGDAVSIDAGGSANAVALGASVVTARWGGLSDAVTLRVHGQDRVPVWFVVEAPWWTPDDAAVYVAGDDPVALGAWDPAGVRVPNVGEDRFAVELPLPRDGAVAYKFTRGAWASVEVQASGQDIGDRRYGPPTADETVYHSVDQWADYR